MPTAKELREQAAPYAKEIYKLRDTAGSWSAEDEKQWDEVNQRYNELISQAEQIERADDVTREIDRRNRERRDNGPGPRNSGSPDQREKPKTPSEKTRCLALQAFCRTNAGLSLSPRHERACKRVGLSTSARQIRFQRPQTEQVRSIQQAFRRGHVTQGAERAMEAWHKRALSSLVGVSGGFITVPESMVMALEVNMLSFSGMLQVAEVMMTDSGEAMGWPTADDTSNEGRQVGEAEDVHNAGAGGTNPTFGKIFWRAWKFTSDMIKVPYELLDEDAAFDLPTVLGAMQGERLGRITNRKYTTGDGNSTPWGIVNRASLGRTTALATAIAADDIIRLEHSVDPAYRTSDCKYMFHDNILLALRLLKDGDGRYLWTSGANFGRPDTLNNYQICINQHMASAMASAAKTMLFGQLNRYKIRRVRGTRMRRFDELYGATDEVAFDTLTREDGNLLTTSTPSVTYLQQAA